MTLWEDKYRIESTRHPDWDYRLPGWYFVTACTSGKACYFGEVRDRVMNLSQAGQIAEVALVNMPSYYSNVRLDAFVVMPNHLHAIIVLEGGHRYTPDDLLRQPGRAMAMSRSKIVSLADVVGSYKAEVSRRCHLAGIREFAWQPRFYDHILRSNATVHAVRDYIQNNPANWAADSDHPAFLHLQH